MAQRRMVSLKIVDTDKFLEMPQTAQCLYFHLLVRADDDGFIGSVRKIMRILGNTDDDLKILIAKQYVIPFQSGVCVIKDWLIHNYIRSDRYNETIYKNEKLLINKGEDASYELKNKNGKPNVIPLVDKRDTQVRLGKDNIDKEKNKFKKPTLEEIKNYISEIGSNVDANEFIDFYSANGWKVGKNPMKDWKATLRGWDRRNNKSANDNKQEGGEYVYNPYL